MKTIQVFVLILCMTAMSCKKDLTGSGNIVTQQRQPGNFIGVISKGDFDVILKKGASTGLELSGEDNVLAKIVTDVSNNMLTVKYDDAIKTHKHRQVVVTVTMPSVSWVQLEGSGNIRTSENWNAHNLRTVLNGSGDMELSAQGDILDAELTGSGYIRMNGTYRSSVVLINGSGYMNAVALTTSNADVRIEGSGRCEINVSDKLKARITGSGKVYYKGHPDTNISVTGSGGAVKVN